ncbi:MAG: AIPR family protein [Schleiferilactobacillus harbinensis]|jgi:AraC-like DNA-binding protein|nr:AIPR family protein [Schleiferilactobacillus harbinensis]MCI1912888.1 AIPR family protein [Schleiferilactobacillus harbinensis]
MANTIEITQLKRVLKNKYKDIIPKEQPTKRTDQDVELNMLSKAITCEALLMTYPGELSPQEAFRMNVDGGQDQGLDAIYYSKKNNELCFVQSKYRSTGKKGIRASEVSEFLRGVTKITTLDFSQFNAKVRAREGEINQIFDSQTDIGCKVLVVQTAPKISSDAQDRLIEFVNKGADNYTFDVIGFDRLYSDLLRGDRNVTLTNVSLRDRGTYETSEGKAYFGELSLDQLYKWWNVYGDRLTDKNLRRSLGDTEINAGIKKTLGLEPENFWFYNNGITIVADRVEYYGTGQPREGGVKMKCINANIVNGAQTYSSVGQYGDQVSDPIAELSNAAILVKIVALQNSEDNEVNQKFLQNITRYNNSQNNVTGRDFLAFDPVQQRIAKQLEPENITYYLMRDESEKNADQAHSFSVRDAVRAVAFAHDADAAIQVKRQIGSVLDKSTPGLYEKLFPQTLTGFKVWNIVQIHRLAEEAIDNEKRNSVGGRKAMIGYARDLLSSLILNKLADGIPSEKICTSDDFQRLNIRERVQSYIESLEDQKIEPTNYKNEFYSVSTFKKLFDELQGSTSVTSKETRISDTIVFPEWISDRDREIFQQFINRIDDEYALRLVKFIIEDVYDPRMEIGYTTNLHFYLRQTGTKESRFLFRLAYYKKAYISFSYHGFGSYESIWLSQSDTIDKYTHGENKMIVQDGETLEKITKLFKILENI